MLSKILSILPYVIISLNIVSGLLLRKYMKALDRIARYTIGDIDLSGEDVAYLLSTRDSSSTMAAFIILINMFLSGVFFVLSLISFIIK